MNKTFTILLLTLSFLATASFIYNIHNFTEDLKVQIALLFVAIVPGVCVFLIGLWIYRGLNGGLE